MSAVVTEPKALPPCPEGELDRKTELFELARRVLRIGHLVGLTLGADFLKALDVAKIRFRRFIGTVLGKEEVTRETTLHFDDISFCAESLDLLF